MLMPFKIIFIFFLNLNDKKYRAMHFLFSLPINFLIFLLFVVFFVLLTETIVPVVLVVLTGVVVTVITLVLRSYRKTRRGEYVIWPN